MNLDRLKYRYWQHTDWHDINSPLEAVYCNAVDGCDPTIAVSDFEFCTGLKDKNGNLIYEGDVVKAATNTYKVIWDRYRWAIKDSQGYVFSEYINDLLYDCEIIGNVHTRSEE